MAPVNIHMEFAVAILFVVNILLALSALTILLRLWSRRARKVTLRLSDYLIILAWITNLPITITSNISITQDSVGQHQSQSGITKEQEMWDYKFSFAKQLCYPITLTLIKISALDLFVSIFPSRIFQRAAYTVMAMTAVWALVFVITTLAACQPLQFYWDRTIPGGKCVNVTKETLVQTLSSMALDIIVVTLPMPMFWGLRLKLKKKIALTTMFGLGIFICIISIIRAILNTTSLATTDPTMYFAKQSVLILTEANLSIINACLPLLQPVGTRLSNAYKALQTRSSRSISLTDHLDPQLSARKSSRETPFADGTETGKLRHLQNHLYTSSYDSTTNITQHDGRGEVSNEGLELDNLGKTRETND